MPPPTHQPPPNRLRRLGFDARKQGRRGIPITNHLNQNSEMLVGGPLDEAEELSDVASVGDKIDIAER